MRIGHLLRGVLRCQRAVCALRGAVGDRLWARRRGVRVVPQWPLRHGQRPVRVQRQQLSEWLLQRRCDGLVRAVPRPVEFLVWYRRHRVRHVRIGPAMHHDDRAVRLRRDLVPQRLLQRQYVPALRLAVVEGVRHRRRGVQRVQHRWHVFGRSVFLRRDVVYGLLQRRHVRGALERVELVLRRGGRGLRGVRVRPDVPERSVRLRRDLLSERLLQRQYVRAVCLRVRQLVRRGGCGLRGVRVRHGVQERSVHL